MKFSDEDLQKLLDQNLSKAEIAQKLGVTKETVRYRTNQLKSKHKSIDPEILDLEAQTDKIDCKSALTLQEQIFLDLHLIEKKSIKDAMIQAGYQNLPERTIYFRAKKILQKYEVKAGDHRFVMRTIGCGEVGVISKMWEEAQNAQSAVARVQALTTLGKWLGLAKEIVEGKQGVTIVIQGPDGQAAAIGPAPQSPAAPPTPGPHLLPPGKPIQITD
jgi:orotate phosphoribosyltransferase-like protein